ncbi:hypothetical protein DSL64_08485 [Dyadobacter luteus]|uniref:DUF3857 domain-containing protein n=1 Tax=Dyadobacter luteus TaxID=2259619 RepID=A0A3D8YCP9_9BACT|nr:DUF3857 domain-containing protein [Dyadobacter luteus]REA62297.1 hypothetical protein DSL64_08485 [Dyadobacter luteus]
MNFCSPGFTTRCSVWVIAFFFTTICVSGAYAQEKDFKPKLGYIDRASLEATAAKEDSSAEAVYLYDSGNLRFSYDERKGLVMLMDYWFRIKILKESALDRASVALTYYDGPDLSKKESVYGIKAYTHNLEDNRIVTTELEKRAVKDEKTSSDYRTQKFNLPNVKKGAVIEYFYTRETPLALKNEPDMWKFQGDLPSQWSEYRIVIPYFLEYKMTLGGYLPLFINKQEVVDVNVGYEAYKGRGISYRFVVKDAPAFTDEPFITTSADYLSRIRFELASVSIPGQAQRRFSQTWDQVDRTLDQVAWFGGELRKTSYLREVRDRINSTAKEPEEKLKLAYAHLQKHMKWDGYSGVGSRDGAKKAYEYKKGSASDINLALVSLLRELDLDANPVVLSTRSHGRIIEEIPMLESFNYVIAHVKVGENEYLLDATSSYTRPGMLPEHVLNGKGRLIPKKGTGRFIPLTSKDSKSKLDIVDAEINPEDGVITGRVNTSLGGYEALFWRGKYNSETDDVYQSDLKKSLEQWQISNLAIKNRDEELKAAVNIKYDFEAEDDNLHPGGFYFNPVIVGRWGANPLRAQERIYPLDLATGISNTYIANFKLPDGYVLEEIPKAEVILLPEKAGRFTYQIRQEDNIIQVNSSVSVTKTSFTAEEYHDVKEFFERIVQQHAKPLRVIKK